MSCVLQGVEEVEEAPVSAMNSPGESSARRLSRQVKQSGREKEGKVAALQAVK